MAAAGASVIIADFDGAAAETVKGEIVARGGGKAEALSVDVTRSDEIKALVTDIRSRYGRIDVLANIAGGSFYTKRIEDFTWTEWKEVIGVNLKGTFLMCRAVAPIMQKQRSGRILNTRIQLRGYRFAAPYALRGGQGRNHRLQQIASSRACATRCPGQYGGARADRHAESDGERIP
jgi:NAD(P)-dependent dehydrogenase (short-subunit alcohol dehydrogenase family)